MTQTSRRLNPGRDRDAQVRAWRERHNIDPWLSDPILTEQALEQDHVDALEMLSPRGEA